MFLRYLRSGLPLTLAALSLGGSPFGCGGDVESTVYARGGGQAGDVNGGGAAGDAGNAAASESGAAGQPAGGATTDELPYCPNTFEDETYGEYVGECRRTGPCGYSAWSDWKECLTPFEGPPPESVRVLVNCEEVPRVNDESRSGWIFDSDSAALLDRSIRLTGALCEQVEQVGVRVDVIHTCSMILLCP
jgi:hypothetical protein